MERYLVRPDRFEEQPVLVLRDHALQMEAHVLPAVGNNCIRFTIQRNGVPVDLLVPPTSLAELSARSVYFGNPILFPFPNRVRAGRFQFGGETHQLRLTSPTEGNAIHGLVHGKPWHVENWGADAQTGAWVTSAILATEHADIVEQFPYPFRLSLTYVLKDGALIQKAQVENVGAKPLPMGYGIHPWFPLPQERRGQVLVRVPAKSRWELEACLPTGRVLPATGAFDLRTLQPLGNRELDDLYTDLEFHDGWCDCLMRDEAAGIELRVRSDQAFREVIVYAPHKRPTICFEPYTCTTDVFNLAANGVDAGLVVLEPGQKWAGEIRFEASII